MFNPNFMINGYMKGMSLGATWFVSSIPLWLWLVIISLGVLKATTKKKSRRTR